MDVWRFVEFWGYLGGWRLRGGFGVGSVGLVWWFVFDFMALTGLIFVGGRLWFDHCVFLYLTVVVLVG